MHDIYPFLIRKKSPQKNSVDTDYPLLAAASLIVNGSGNRRLSNKEYHFRNVSAGISGNVGVCVCVRVAELYGGVVFNANKIQ